MNSFTIYSQDDIPEPVDGGPSQSLPDCSCSPLPSTICPTPQPLDQYCDNIRMFFGYSIPSGVNGNIPGKIDKLFKTNPQNSNDINEGFKIYNFSAQPLFDARIIPNNFSFTLSERELLAAGSFEAWMSHTADYLDAQLSSTINLDGASPFGAHCLQSLGYSLEKARLAAINMGLAIRKGDMSAVFSALQNLLFAEPNISTVEGMTDCIGASQKQRIEKLNLCYAWFKNLVDNYYGKSFLVRVSDQNNPNRNICIKNESGVSINNTNLPLYIEGDGSSQGYYTSDEIADGGFPKYQSSSDSLLGVKNIDWIQNSDGKISSFALIGRIWTTNNDCAGILQDRVIYRKFKDYTGVCGEWTIDLSKLSPENYYIENIGNTGYLYLKCGIDNRFYVDSEGTWVHMTLSEKVPLTAAGNHSSLALYAYLYLCESVRNKKTAQNLLTSIGTIGPLVGAAYPIASYFFGAISSRSQANLFNPNSICLIPEGAIVPFKSNVYRYGPYYHISNPDNGGGVDLVIDENIAPWNFIRPGSSGIPNDYPYCAMDKYGKELSQLVTKGLQKLEKGKATVVGLPCYTIGHFVDQTGVYNNFEIGPTLLTDINVDFGSGGFNTTYNFSTYTPRLGRSEKYLKDSWTQKIEDNKYVNNYLRSEREKVNNIKKDYTKSILQKDAFFTPLPEFKSSTPNKFMFAGYYFSDNIVDYDVLNPSDYGPGATGMIPDPSCSPSGFVYTSMTIPQSPTVSGTRHYTFAETDKGYTIQYLQDTYYQLASMSLDGLYLPVSLRGVCADPKIPEILDSVTKNPNWQNNARLPRFVMYCKSLSNPIQFIEWDNDTDLTTINSSIGYPISSKTRDQIPPFRLIDPSGTPCYLLPINQKYLNPYATSRILRDTWDDGRKNESDAGFVISSIAFGQKYTDFQLTHTNKKERDSSDFAGSSIYKEEDTDEYIRQQQINFRVPALRGPLVLQGWGYDTSGKPIPNAADNYINAEHGQFRPDQLTDKFMKNWLENPKSWPVGPVDLRFDRERGVWTCPSPNKIVAIRLKENLSSLGQAKAQLVNPVSIGISGSVRFYEKYFISGPNGENIKLHMDNTEITVCDFLGESVPKCSLAYAYYDDNRYIILNTAKQQSSVIVGYANGNFTPLNNTATIISPICYPSGSISCSNPMGYGALKGDLVTVSRCPDGLSYIIIGTGAPPSGCGCSPC